MVARPGGRIAAAAAAAAAKAVAEKAEALAAKKEATKAAKAQAAEEEPDLEDAEDLDEEGEEIQAASSTKRSRLRRWAKAGHKLTLTRQILPGFIIRLNRNTFSIRQTLLSVLEPETLLVEVHISFLQDLLQKVV